MDMCLSFRVFSYRVNYSIIIRVNDQMRRFRQSLKEPEYRLFDTPYDTKTLKDEVHLLTILDSCSQILRDDRIWLRKRVKENDPEVIGMLKAAMKGQKQLNMVNTRQLQISLRKYVFRVKEMLKEEQLIKFKENVLANECKRKKGRQSEGMSVSNSWKNMRIQEKKYSGASYSLPRQQSFFSKIPEPIEEENSSEKESSHPSRSSEPFSHYQRESNRNSFVFRRDQNRADGFSRRSSNDRELIDGYGGRESLYTMKQSKSNGMLRNDRTGFQKSIGDPRKEWEKESHILKDLKLDTFREKEELMTFKPAQSFDGIDTFTQSKNPIHLVPNKEKDPFGEKQGKYAESSSQSRISLPIKICEDEQNLFTSPELLMECRLFIERNSTSKRKRETDPVIVAPSPVALSFQPQLRREEPPTQQRMEEKGGGDEIEDIDDVQEMEEKQPHPGAFGVDEQVTFQPSHPPLRKKIEEQFKETILDTLFGEKTIISNFHSLLLSTYEQTATLQNLMSRTGNQILYQQLGALLEVYCPLNEPNGGIRDVFNFIDLQKNGYFTAEDLEVFLCQILESESDPVYSLGSKIFEMAEKDGRVEYWSLYRIKQSDEVKEFLAFLSQFEFEVES